MIPTSALRRWLDALPDDSVVGIDEGGLTLVALDGAGTPIGANCEVGGYGDDEG